MRLCLMMGQLLIFLAMGVQSFPNTGDQENRNADKDLQSVENQNQIPGSSELAFLAARSCHVQFSKDSGTFSPPVFYGKTNVNLWCNWTILAAPEKHIVIYIEGFSTETDCDDNQDEIIFQGISSSVETTTVYACWNKPTHIYSTQAHVVNILFLWRTFSRIGSRQYFEGRYFIFDDSKAVLSSCNCSLKLNKSMTERTITTDPKETPIMITPLYSPVPPAWPFSKRISVQVQDSETTTSQATLYDAHILTAINTESTMLKAFSTTVVQPVSPLPSFSTMVSEGKEPTDTLILEDLQPSHVGQWEHSASSIWVWEITSSQSMSETPKLNTAHATGHLKTSKFNITPYFNPTIQLPVTQHYNTDYIADFTGDHGITHFAELSKTTDLIMPYTTRLPKNLYFTISHVEDLLKTLHFNQAEGYDPELLGVKHFSSTLAAEITEIPNHVTSQFIKLTAAAPFRLFPQAPFTKTVIETKLPAIYQMTKFPDVGISHTNKITVPPQSLSIDPTNILYPRTENAMTHSNLSRFSLRHLIEPTLYLEKFPEMSLSSVSVKMHQDVSSYHSETAKFSTTTSLSERAESQLKDIVSVRTLSWHVTSLPSTIAAAEAMKSILTAGRQTLTSLPSLLHPAPGQLTSLLKENVFSSPENTFSVKSMVIFLGTTSLSNSIGSQTSADPQELQSVFSSIFPPMLKLYSIMPESSAINLPMPVLDKNYLEPERTPAVKHTFIASSSHVDMAVLDGQMVPEVMVSPPSSQGLSVKSTVLEISPPFKEMLSKMGSESQTLPTEDYKPTESYRKVTRQLESWSRSTILHSSSYDKITTQTFTSSSVTYMSLFGQILKGVTLPFKNEDTGAKAPENSVGKKKNATKVYTSDHLDLKQEEAGKSKDDDFGYNLPSMLAFVPARSCHVQFSKTSGTFSPPVFDRKIDVNLWCNWTILAAPEKHIAIYIDGFTADTDCDDNQDEILFQDFSSSVETTIVYACWNKPTNTYATQAHAVSVLFLWRTFSRTGLKKYFEGRYFIFDDPDASLSSCKCSINLNNSMLETTINTDPKKPPKIALALYSPVLPARSSTKISYDQMQISKSGTSQDTVYEAHILSMGTTETDLLKDDSTTIAQPTYPSSSFSTMMSKDKEHKETWPVEDLQPSLIGQWEQSASSSFWIWEKTSSQSMSETPKLSTAHAIGILEESNFRITLSSEIPVTLYFGLGHNIELPVTRHFIKDDVTDLLELQSITRVADQTKTSDIHIFYTEYFLETISLNPDISQYLFGSMLFSADHATPLPEMPPYVTNQFIKPPVVVSFSIIPQTSFTKTIIETKLSEIHHAIEQMAQLRDVSISHTSEIIVLPQSLVHAMPYLYVSHLSLSHFIEPTLRLEGFLEVFRSKLIPEMFSSSDTVKVNQNVSSSYETSKLLIKIPLLESAKSQLRDIVLAHTMSWHATSFPYKTAAFETVKNIFIADGQITEMSTPSLVHLSPDQFTSLPEENALLSPEKTSGLRNPAIFLTTTSLSHSIGSQTPFDPQQQQSVSSGTSPPLLKLHPVRLETSAVNSLIHMSDNSCSECPLAVKPKISDFSLHGDTAVLSQEMVPKIMTSSSSPGFLVKPIPSELSPQFKEVSSKMETKGQTLPTEEYKPTESLKKVTRQLKSVSVTPIVRDSSYENKMTTQPFTSSAMTHMSSFSQLLKSTSIPFKHEDWKLQDTHLPQQTNKPQPSLHVDNEKSTQISPTGNNENLIKTDSRASDAPDLDQKEDSGQSVADDFDNMDTINVLINQRDLGISHNPGDSLFEIIAAIKHKHVSLRGLENELTEALKAKIAERINLFPGGINELVLKDVAMTNANRSTLTFWLHLKSGGKKMANFIITQVKTLEEEPIGSVNATLVSLSVEDVNECQLGIQNCDAKAHCENVVGTYLCRCISETEDHSPDSLGSLCIVPEPEETQSLQEYMGILIASTVSVGGTLLLLILILCIVHLRRRARVNVNLQMPPKQHRLPEALPVYPGEHDQTLPGLARHLSSMHSQEPLPARDTSSKLELTKITFEQTAC